MVIRNYWSKRTSTEYREPHEYAKAGRIWTKWIVTLLHLQTAFE
jgi:hypothetical protein